MVLVSSLLRTLRERWTIHTAAQYARRYGITVPFAMQYNDALTLNEIFVQRDYALCFPRNIAGVTIVDIGAHKGFFTVFAARNAPRAARIVSVEPCKQSFELMRRMATANNAPGHTAVHAAITSTCGEGVLMTGAGVFNHLRSDTDTVPAGVETEPVRLITLRALFDELRLARVDFLKMDIEGAEYESLLGADSKTLERIAVISMEFHESRAEGTNADTLVRHLSAAGYSIARYEYSPNDLDLNMGKIVAVRR